MIHLPQQPAANKQAVGKSRRTSNVAKLAARLDLS